MQNYAVIWNIVTFLTSHIARDESTTGVHIHQKLKDGLLKKRWLTSTASLEADQVALRAVQIDLHSQGHW